MKAHLLDGVVSLVASENSVEVQLDESLSSSICKGWEWEMRFPIQEGLQEQPAEGCLEIEYYEDGSVKRVQYSSDCQIFSISLQIDSKR